MDLARPKTDLSSALVALVAGLPLEKVKHKQVRPWSVQVAGDGPFDMA